MKTSHFFQNIITNNASQGLQFGSRWVFNIALINVLDITSYALFSFIYSISNILLAVLPFGSPTYLINEVEDQEGGIKKLFDSFVISFILTGLLLLLYLLLDFFISDIKGWEYYGYGIALGFILSLNISLFSYYKGLGKFLIELKAYAVFFLFLIGFVAYLFFIPNARKDISFVFILLIGINSLVFLLTVFSSKRIVTAFKSISVRRGVRRISNAFTERTYFGLQEMTTAFYAQSGMLLLFYLLDTATYGYYRALFVVIAPLLLITVSFSQVMLNYIKNLKSTLFILTFRKIQGYSLAVGFMFVFAFYMLKDFLFGIIKVPINDNTTLAFGIVLGAILIRFMFTNYEMILVVLGKQKQRFYVVLCVAFINIGLIFTLLPKYGLIGAVSTNLLTYFVLLIGLLFSAESYLKKNL
ncbi:lipopolysaccharide biosynthesis protein [Patiriisocius sp. Uisw_017]|uniref:lipopolysaccharide biosynthesis protein n=1 Tax=Patiriisocius sp. Uisw_017 TaxID=3230968 RepID=UPI0039ED5788